MKENYADELQNIGAILLFDCGSPDEQIQVDISKVQRVFGNIIGNSIKHTKVIPLTIKIHCTKQDRGLVFSVSDNGSGVPQEELNQIFEPLYSSDKSRGVAGLGLSICKSIVEAHGGRIWAEINELGGLCVLFTLNEISM